MHSPSLLFFFVFGCIVISAFAIGIIVYIGFQKQRQVKDHLERQQLEFDYKDALLRSRLEAQETTLSAVSLELHDSVNQMLTSGVNQFRLAEMYIRDAEGLKAMEEGKEIVCEAMAAIRSLSHSLHTGLVSDMSLEEALSQELDRVTRSSGISGNCEVTGRWEPGPDARLILFRIAQEALQNVVKHAEASTVRLHIDSSPERYLLSITDDGIGFDICAKPNEASLGLRSMKERVVLLEGKVDLWSARGSGTRVILEVPIKPKNT